MQQEAKKVGGWFTQGQSGRWAMLPVEAILDKRLKAKHFAVLTVLCLHANRAGVCTVTCETIGQFLDYTKDHVWKTLRDLKHFGWISRSKAVVLQPSETQLENPAFGPDDLRVVHEFHMQRLAEGDEALRVVEDRRLPDEEYQALIAAKKAEIFAAAKANRAKRDAVAMDRFHEQLELPTSEPVGEVVSVAVSAVRKVSEVSPACPSEGEARRALLHFIKSDGEKLYSDWSVKSFGFTDGYGEFYELEDLAD